jgi:hypothetical protein
MHLNCGFETTGENQLTDNDLDNICAFALHMEGSGFPCSTYDNLRWFFRCKLNLDTEYLMYRHIEFLSGIKPTFYDMYNKSCLLFVDSFKDLMHCSFCGLPHYHANNKPIAHFLYLPIPHMQGWYECLSMIDCLKYHSQHTHEPGEYHDVFDGSHYCTLQDRHVEVLGQMLAHKYFSDARDITLGASTDGFQVCLFGTKSIKY